MFIQNYSLSFENNLVKTLIKNSSVFQFYLKKISKSFVGLLI